MSKIISAPSPVLSQKAKDYTFKSKDNFLPKLLKEMEEALLSAKDPKGVGLAAPQIGKSLSIFITKPTEKSKIQVFINPKIIEFGDKKPATKGKKQIKKPLKLEGCLSLPSIWGEVKRSTEVKISYFDEKEEKKTEKFDGFMATIVQHEIDHLYGVLFPKRVLEQKGRLFHSSKNKEGEDEFEELSI